MRTTFRFSPKILARLGEELNQSFDQSVLELVKNAYDADATRCSIELRGASRAGGSVIVSDDGDGMDDDRIAEGWLVLGRSSKSSLTPTKLGRIPAGSKGLGRLAALRMGTRVHLKSIPKSNSRRLYSLNINWSEFDDATVVEDVPLTIEVEKNSSGGHGSRVELYGLRVPISSEEIKRMARSILLLTDPFGSKNAGFSVSLVAPEFREFENLVRQNYFSAADYHLTGTLAKDGQATVELKDWQGKTMASAVLNGRRRGQDKDRPYLAPLAKFDLWVFLLSGPTEAFSARKVTVTEVRRWLQAFGGVHVYQDDIRVAPYGNVGNDWLEMNLARVRSPEERPGTNTSIGKVQVASAGLRALRQKTDRTGFIEDEHFRELRAFLKDSLDWLAKWRLDVAEKRRASTRIEAPKVANLQRDRVESAIALIPSQHRQKLEDAFAGYERTRDREAAELRNEVQLYRTLSTAGITAATFSHESHGSPLKAIDLAVTALVKRIPKLVPEDVRERLMAPARDIEKAAASLSTLTFATLSLVKAGKRRSQRVSVHDCIRQVARLFSPFIDGRGAELTLNLTGGDPYLKTSEAAVESILANLLNNSLAAFERGATRVRRIEIATAIQQDRLEMTVADSGPGIVDLDVEEMWLPGITSNPEGTGLGLTIVKDTVRDMGGTASAKASGKLGGAEVTVCLPILGA